MAKLTAPLFSFGARGALAKTLVYFPWKGIDSVRSYVIPANPRSSGQQTQRGYFTDAVDAWHTTGLSEDDVAAWNRYAATQPTPRSGFNSFVSRVIDLLVGGLMLGSLDMGFNGGISDSGSGQVDMTIEENGTATTVNFHWGYSPTSLINTVPGAETANVWNALNVAAAPGSTVYMRASIETAGPTINGETGIYRFGPVTT